MLSVTLTIILLSLIMQSIILLSVILTSIILLSVILTSIILLNVILLIVILPIGIMCHLEEWHCTSVILLSTIQVSVIMINVVAPFVFTNIFFSFGKKSINFNRKLQLFFKNCKRMIFEKFLNFIFFQKKITQNLEI
jgi:hypothetical protein